MLAPDALSNLYIKSIDKCIKIVYNISLKSSGHGQTYKPLYTYIITMKAKKSLKVFTNSIKKVCKKSLKVLKQLGKPY